MTRTDAGGRGTDPLAAEILLRRPERALRYGLARRLSDAWAGRRDGVVDLRALSPSTGGTWLDEAVAASWRWLARNQATFTERDHREFLEAQAAVAGVRAHYSVLHTSLATAMEEWERLGEARSALPGEPSPEALTLRGPAEGADSPAVIAMRRRAEHRRVLTQADAELMRARARVEALREEQARVLAALNEVFEAQITRSERLRAFHQRRQEVYLRAFRRAVLRRHPEPSSLRLPTPGIAAPAWTQQPCPWTTTPTNQPALRLVS